LYEETADWAAKEASAAGTQLIFAPMVDISRDPRWGRIAEGPGEDPYLAARFAEGKVRGFQGRHWEKAAATSVCVKHFIGYGAVEGGRDYSGVEMSLQTMKEVYLPPFQSAVKAGVQMVMASFNDFNGVPVTANRYLLTDLLRGELGFEGVIIGDDKTIAKLIVQGLAGTPKEACKKSIFAGTDMDMNSGIFLEYLADLVRQGDIPESLINASVARILRIKLTNDLFTYPYVEHPEWAESTAFRGEIHAAARDAARRSIVLLKNEGRLLPIGQNIHKLAILGPLAHDRSVLGCWSCYGQTAETVTVLEGIQAHCPPGIELLYTQGCKISGDDRDGFTDAVQLAQAADIVLVVVGENASMSGEGMCRSDLSLPGVQEDLVKALYATGTPLTVLLMNGRPLSFPWIAEHVPAIVESWFLGSQTGNAIADVLFGKFNPAGKLTVSFPKNVGQIPVHYNHKQSGRPDTGGKRFASRYLDLSSEPLYPFGYGLSYSQFAYHDLTLSPTRITKEQTLTVGVTLENLGPWDGEEVVQLYLNDVTASCTRPIKELKGFQKIALRSGEKSRVEFRIKAEQLRYYDPTMRYDVEPGIFKVWVGPDSARGLEGSFELLE
ncbi:MAG TPA: glycoside hydrolase family 3 N-terminal domain-containing protein, partial [Bacillota bacterium]|nr:glycoside hydrolase family 3 N-terminal domain-containing protein [Bacillota bacterium]